LFDRRFVFIIHSWAANNKQGREINEFHSENCIALPIIHSKQTFRPLTPFRLYDDDD